MRAFARRLLPFLLAAGACGSDPSTGADAGVDGAPDATDAGTDLGDRPSGDAGVVQVVAGAFHSCALRGDGTVWCWGLGESIAPGGDTIVRPRRIDGVAGARRLAAGRHQTCALGDQGLRCFGNRTFEVVAEDGSPLPEVTEVAVGPGYGCAAARTGVHCWGSNEMGQLARPLAVSDSPRALVALPGSQRLLAAGQAVAAHDGSQLCLWGSNASKQVADDDLNTVFATPRCGPLGEAAQLVAGADHLCARRPGGTFTCWGERYYGQLGIGGGLDDTLDVAPFGADTTLRAPVVSLAAGTSHTCALLADGAVLCFGRNHLGQMGAVTPAEEVRTPIAVGALAGKVVAIGAGSSAQHTCAVLESGAVQCWGHNSDGQLGSGAPGRDPARFSATPLTVPF